MRPDYLDPNGIAIEESEHITLQPIKVASDTSKIVMRIANHIANPEILNEKMDASVGNTLSRDYLMNLREAILDGVAPEYEIKDLAPGVGKGNLDLATADIMMLAREARVSKDVDDVARALTGLYQVMGNPPLFDKWNKMTTSVVASRMADEAGYTLNIADVPIEVAFSDQVNNKFDPEEIVSYIKGALTAHSEPKFGMSELPTMEVEDSHSGPGMRM